MRDFFVIACTELKNRIFSCDNSEEASGAVEMQDTSQYDVASSLAYRQ